MAHTTSHSDDQPGKRDAWQSSAGGWQTDGSDNDGRYDAGDSVAAHLVSGAHFAVPDDDGTRGAHMAPGSWDQAPDDAQAGAASPTQPSPRSSSPAQQPASSASAQARRSPSAGDPQPNGRPDASGPSARQSSASARPGVRGQQDAGSEPASKPSPRPLRLASKQPAQRQAGAAQTPQPRAGQNVAQQNPNGPSAEPRPRLQDRLGFKPRRRQSASAQGTPQGSPVNQGPAAQGQGPSQSAPRTRVASEYYRKRSHRQNHKSEVRRNVLIVALSLLAACLVVMVVTGFTAASEANRVVNDLKGAVSATASGDADTLNSQVSDLQEATDDLRATVNGPVFSALANIGFGRDVASVRSMVDVLDVANQEVMVPLAQHGDQLKGDVMEEDTINVDALTQLISIAEDLRPGIQKVSDAASNMDSAALPQLSSVTSKIKSLLECADPLIDSLSTLKPALPSLLGANGKTASYLLIAQNNAELRPTGGIPGSWGVVTVDNGKIKFSSLGEPDEYTKQGIQISEADRDLMGEYYTYMKPDQFWVSANFDPDFPRSAKHLATYWSLIKQENISGVDPDTPDEVDGVVAVDPIVVQSLLGLTDGFDVDGHHIDGTNATKVLLSDSYWNVDQDQQNSYFGDVASGALQTIMSSLGSMNPSSLYDVVMDAGQKGHIQVWCQDQTAQKAIEQLGFSGETSDDANNPQLGTYFYDITWSKMDWYLNQTTTVGSAQQNSDGTTSYTVTTTLINQMTESEAQSAPDYVVSFGDNKLVANRGGMATVVYLYAPYGGNISNLQCNSGTFSKISTNGYYVYRGLVILDPQKRETITYTVTTAAGATGDLSVRSTPTCTEVAGWRSDKRGDDSYELQDSSSYADPDGAADNYKSGYTSTKPRNRGYGTNDTSSSSSSASSSSGSSSDYSDDSASSSSYNSGYHGQSGSSSDRDDDD